MNLIAIDTLSLKLSPTTRYILASGLAIIAFAIRLLILPEDVSPKFTTFYPAVVMSFYFCGRRAGVVTLILCLILADYFLFAPFNQFSMNHETMVNLVLFALASGMIGYIVSRMTTYHEQLIATERELSRYKLHEASQSLNLAVEGASLGVWRAQASERVITFSDIFAHQFGIEPGIRCLTNQKLLEVIHTEDQANVKSAFDLTISELADLSVEFRVIWPDKSEHWISVLGRPLTSPKGVLEHIDGVTIDITEQRRLRDDLEEEVKKRTEELAAANKRLEEISRRDALTGLFNRMATNERLQIEFVRMKRTGEPYAVLMLDIDFFKRINDTFGHPVGDDVLCSVAKTLSKGIRENDFIARYGGEEFIIILPGTTFNQALIVAEKLRRSINEELNETVGRITVSIGFAIANSDQADEQESVTAADKALYRAKEDGRNRVVGYQS